MNPSFSKGLWTL